MRQLYCLCADQALGAGGKKKHSFPDKCVPKCNLGTRERAAVARAGSARVRACEHFPIPLSRNALRAPALSQRGLPGFLARFCLLFKPHLLLFRYSVTPSLFRGNRRGIQGTFSVIRNPGALRNVIFLYTEVEP
jgi:hypothetical protein